MSRMTDFSGLGAFSQNKQQPSQTQFDKKNPPLRTKGPSEFDKEKPLQIRMNGAEFDKKMPP